MNHINIDRKRACTGCFACAGACPKGAIKLATDENGFYKPSVDEKLCVSCGLCRDVCYSHIKEFEKSEELKAYYGWHKNHGVLNNSASGGISSAMCQVAIENGYLVVGCGYDSNSHKAKHIIIQGRADVPKIHGSKYFQSDLSEVMETLRGLSNDAKLLFFGTPCQVLGLKEMLKKLHHNMDNVLFVELFCHGIASPQVWESYLEEQKLDKAKAVKFRTKYYGWHVPTNEFITNNKTVPTKKSGDKFFEAYYSTEFFNMACYDCEARANLVNGDVRIGDYWGERFVDNKTGVSCILSSTQKGAWLLEQCKKYFELFDGDMKEILVAQSYQKKHTFQKENWNQNFSLLREQGLNRSLVNIRKRRPLLSRAKRSVYIWLSNIKSNLTHKF